MLIKSQGVYILATPSRYALYHLFPVLGDQHLQKTGCKSVGGGSLQSLDWNEWTGAVDWNGGMIIVLHDPTFQIFQQH